MPPSYKFTKEEIIEAAFELTREKGIESLTARALASRLSSSPKIIFGSFSGMDELKEKVTIRARDFFSERMMEALSDRSMLPYLSCSLCYVIFAHEEKNLFKLLYFRVYEERPKSAMDDTLPIIYKVISDKVHVSLETAKEMHRRFSIFSHGLACTEVFSNKPVPIETYKELLEDNWKELRLHYAGF